MKNITDLRNELATNYTEIKADKMALDKAKELANTAGKMLTSLKVEIEYNKLNCIKTKIDFLEQTPAK